VGGLDEVVPFLVTDNLSVPTLVGTSFIDDYIDVILPPERQLIVKGQRVAVLENPNESHDHPAPLRAAKSYVIPPMSQLAINVSCSRSGLSVIQQKLKKSFWSRPFIANGLVELPQALPGRHSTVMVASMQDKPLRVQKGPSHWGS
jgi:hypothetical protein